MLCRVWCVARPSSNRHTPATGASVAASANGCGCRTPNPSESACEARRPSNKGQSCLGLGRTPACQLARQPDYPHLSASCRIDLGSMLCSRARRTPALATSAMASCVLPSSIIRTCIATYTLQCWPCLPTSKRMCRSKGGVPTLSNFSRSLPSFIRPSTAASSDAVVASLFAGVDSASLHKRASRLCHQCSLLAYGGGSHKPSATHNPKARHQLLHMGFCTLT